MQDITIAVTSLMTKQVACTSPGADLMEVIYTMLDRRCSCMVITEDNVPVGIVTERDFVRLLAELKDRRPFYSIKVGEVMSQPVITVSEYTTLFEALVITSAQKLRHLPVVNEEKQLKGIVTLDNLAHAHFHIYEKQRELIENSITTRTRELEEANEKLKALSMVDALCGIGNRRAMEVDMEYTHAQAFRFGRSYAVALLDIDFFKLYNDHYGHLAGDKALRAVAEHLMSRIRKADRLYRYGGEEMLLLLPETPLEGAEILMNRILQSLEELAIPHCDSPHRVLTMSCGLAFQPEEGERHTSWQDVIAFADRGLYLSKHNGRNRVTAMYHDLLTEPRKPCVSPLNEKLFSSGY